MAKRYDICTPRKSKDGKTFWTRIGSAWVNDSGQTQLVFDALPLPDAEGRCVANLFEPRERDAAPARGKPAPAQSTWDDDGDSVPF
jgi:hypothetical protein